jgi:hypothetical protein
LLQRRNSSTTKTFLLKVNIWWRLVQWNPNERIAEQMSDNRPSWSWSSPWSWSHSSDRHSTTALLPLTSSSCHPLLTQDIRTVQILCNWNPHRRQSPRSWFRGRTGIPEG